MALLGQIICALLVVAVLLNGGECRPEPVLGAVSSLAGGLPGAAALPAILLPVAGALPLPGGR